MKSIIHQVGVGRSTRELRPDTNNAVFDSRVLSKHQVGTCVDFFCFDIFVLHQPMDIRNKERFLTMISH